MYCKIRGRELPNGAEFFLYCGKKVFCGQPDWTAQTGPPFPLNRRPLEIQVPVH